MRKHNQYTGRSTAELLNDFGGGMPTKPAGPASQSPKQRSNGRIKPARGPRQRGTGHSAVLPRLPVMQATTDVIGAWYPLHADPVLPAVGARIGYDVSSGSAFYAHPMEWVLRALVTNPNIVVFGEPGTGKTSTIAGFLLRMMVFGHRTLIGGDVKGEYNDLCAALGHPAIRLADGSYRRVNPLDLGPLRAVWDTWSPQRQGEELHGVLGRWETLLAALCSAQGYQVGVSDARALGWVLRELIGVHDGTSQPRPVAPPAVVDALEHPTDEMVRDLRYATHQQALDELRGVTNALAGMIKGPLAGLFDEHTNFELDWSAPIQSMDLHPIEARGEAAVGAALACLGSWSSLAAHVQDSDRARIVVRDEVWRQMRLGPGLVEALDASLRLSRAKNSIECLLMHKPDDLAGVGDTGSQAVNIARSMISLCGTRVLFGQSAAVSDELATEIGLHAHEQDAVTGWANDKLGRALWKVGHQPGFKVQAVRTPTEKHALDTNVQVRGNSINDPAEAATDDAVDTGALDG